MCYLGKFDLPERSRVAHWYLARSGGNHGLSQSQT